MGKNVSWELRQAKNIKVFSQLIGKNEEKKKNLIYKKLASYLKEEGLDNFYDKSTVTRINAQQN